MLLFLSLLMAPAWAEGLTANPSLNPVPAKAVPLHTIIAPQAVGSFRPNVTVIDVVKPPSPLIQESPLAPGAVPVSGYAPGDPAADAERERNRMIQAYSGLNTTNPMSEQFDPSGVAAANLPPEVKAQVEKMKVLLDNPMIKKSLKIFSDPEIAKLTQELTQSKGLKTLMGIEAALFILFLFFKSWRSGRAKGFLGRVWVGIYSTALYWSVSVIAVPWFILGNSWGSLLKVLMKNATI